MRQICAAGHCVSPQQGRIVTSNGRSSIASRADNGLMLGWGDNHSTVLGTGPSRTANNYCTAQAAVSTLGAVSSVGTTGNPYYSCAVGAADSVVRCWGNGSTASCYLGPSATGTVTAPCADYTFTPRAVWTGTTAAGGVALTATSVTVSVGVAVALLADGTLRSWGGGYLGDGTNAVSGLSLATVSTSVGVPLSGATAVSFTFQHGCVIRSDGSLWCWGNNGDGRVGDGTRTSRLFAVQVYVNATTPLTNVVDVTDVGTARGVPYLVMEMLDGEALAARIRRGPIAPGELASLMLPVCAAVAAAHAQGVLHRDLKPDNILLERTPQGPVRPKVLDFGIAKIFDEDASLSLTNTATVLGTPFYMSPEQARGVRHVDARSDQYALGVILYEGCTGRRPFEGDSLLALAWEITSAELRSPRGLIPELPEDFEAVVLRAMDRDPARRFASVRALGAALLPFDDAPPTPERRVTGPSPRVVLAETVGGPRLPLADRVVPALTPAPTPVPPRRGRLWWAIALACAVPLGVAAYGLTPTPPSPMALARRVAPSAEALPTAPAVVAAEVVAADVVAYDVTADVAADVVTAQAPIARPVRAPARGAPVARRLPPSASGQRDIPME